MSFFAFTRYNQNYRSLRTIRTAANRLFVLWLLVMATDAGAGPRYRSKMSTDLGHIHAYLAPRWNVQNRSPKKARKLLANAIRKNGLNVNRWRYLAGNPQEPTHNLLAATYALGILQGEAMAASYAAGNAAAAPDYPLTATTINDLLASGVKASLNRGSRSGNFRGLGIAGQLGATDSRDFAETVSRSEVASRSARQGLTPTWSLLHAVLRQGMSLGLNEWQRPAPATVVSRTTGNEDHSPTTEQTLKEIFFAAIQIRQ